MMIYFVVQKLLSLTYILLFTSALFSFPRGDRPKNIARLMSKRLVWDLDSSLHRGYLCGYDIPLLGHHTRGVGSDQTVLNFRREIPPTCLSVAFPIYILSCGKSVLLVFRSFLEMVTLYAIYSYPIYQIRSDQLLSRVRLFATP